MKNLKYIIATTALLGACGAANAASMSQVDVLTQQALGVVNCSPAHKACITECMSNTTPLGRASCVQHCPKC